eukprot:COSAG06_NODE_11231_length_1541_cov_1.456311_1_plen_69_part_10
MRRVTPVETPRVDSRGAVSIVHYHRCGWPALKLTPQRIPADAQPPFTAAAATTTFLIGLPLSREAYYG